MRNRRPCQFRWGISQREIPRGGGDLPSAGRGRPRPPSVITPPVALRDRLTRHPALAALGVYVAASLVLLGRPLLDDATNTCLCIGTTTDEGVIAWALEWWPHALLHGLNPFHPSIIYAPHGVDIAQGALMPGLAFALWPVTAVGGPLFAYNVAVLLAPPLAAFFAFLLCRRLTGAFWPSLIGGWLFGFSAYMLGQEAGHMNLAFVFLIPAIVHLAVRASAGELGPRRFGVLLTLALVAQFSLSIEVFVTFALFTAITLLMFWLVGGSEARQAIRLLLGPAVLAYLATAVLVSPYLYYALMPGGLPVDVPRNELFSNDLLGFVVPTEMIRLGGVRFLSTSMKFTAGAMEGAAYLGVPLIVLLFLSARAGWRRVEVKVLTCVLLIAVICSLGARLHVRGSESIPLPWDVVARLPVLGQLIPARLVLYVTLIAAVLAARWLATARIAGWGLALVAVAFLWPAVNLQFWDSRPELPKLFSTTAYRQVLRPHDTVLVLPVGIKGQSMLWQAETRLGFVMASGYVVPPEANDPYKHAAIDPTLTYNATVPREVHAAASFIAAHHITVAVLSSGGAANSPWPGILGQLGWGSVLEYGALVLRPEGLVPEPTQPLPPPRSPRAAGPPGAQRLARRVARDYMVAFVAGDTAGLCSLLTEPALAAQIAHRGAGQALCARELVGLMQRLSALRLIARGTHIGAATLHGSHGYVALRGSGRSMSYLPVREIGGRWLVDGVAQPPSR
jgi:hypothetical protein